jgi:hypothetical protein
VGPGSPAAARGYPAPSRSRDIGVVRELICVTIEAVRWFVVLWLVGCQDSIATPFPPGLEPFDDDDQVDELDASPAEELRTAARDTDMIRIYGRGFVFAPPATVYAAAHDPLVMIATCSTTSQRVTLGNEPEYELSYLVHYFVDDILDVEWDDQWRGGTVPGTAIVKHQKVQGSDFIAVSEGTIAIVDTADPGITELRFVEHLDAVSATPGQVIAGMQHNYDALVAVSHGAPIPACP